VESKPSDSKEEGSNSKLNIVISRLDKAATVSDIESLLSQNNFTFKDVQMLACSEAQKIFGINPSTGFGSESKPHEKEGGGKRYSTFDPDYAYAKINFDTRKDSK